MRHPFAFALVGTLAVLGIAYRILLRPRVKGWW